MLVTSNEVIVAILWLFRMVHVCNEIMIFVSDLILPSTATNLLPKQQDSLRLGGAQYKHMYLYATIKQNY
jgi:hypothetical protein